jgi:hypothetical protein
MVIAEGETLESWTQCAREASAPELLELLKSRALASETMAEGTIPPADFEWPEDILLYLAEREWRSGLAPLSTRLGEAITRYFSDPALEPLRVDLKVVRAVLRVMEVQATRLPFVAPHVWYVQAVTLPQSTARAWYTTHRATLMDRRYTPLVNALFAVLTSAQTAPVPQYGLRHFWLEAWHNETPDRQLRALQGLHGCCPGSAVAEIPLVFERVSRVGGTIEPILRWFSVTDLRTWARNYEDDALISHIEALLAEPLRNGGFMA